MLVFLSFLQEDLYSSWNKWQFRVHNSGSVKAEMRGEKWSEVSVVVTCLKHSEYTLIMFSQLSVWPFKEGWLDDGQAATMGEQQDVGVF